MGSSGSLVDRQDGSGAGRRCERLDRSGPSLGLVLGRSSLALGAELRPGFRLPAEERVEHVLMAVTLAAARRFRALHHRLKPTGHIHLQNFVASNETMLLWQTGGKNQRHGVTNYSLNHQRFSDSFYKVQLTNSWWYFGLFLWSFVRLLTNMRDAYVF